MSNLVDHSAGTVEIVGDEPGTSLAPRPDSALVPPSPPVTPVADGVNRSKGPGRFTVSVIAAGLVAAVAVGAAVFGGGSTAGGSDSGGGASNAAGAAHGSLAASAASSASAPSVSFQVSATETTPNSTSTLLHGHGSADLQTGVGRLTATIPALSPLLGSGNRGPLDVISDGTDVYLDIPGVSSLTGGKSWVETSLAGLGSLTGSSASSLSLSTLADPAQALDMLGSLGSPVTKVGTVTLGGKPVTEYRSTITMADIASTLSHGSAASSAAAGAIQRLGIPSLPVTAWVGRDGRLRQLSVSADLSHASLGGLLGSLGAGSGPSTVGTSVNLTIGLSHYGEPVSVAVPPASEVTNLNSIASSLKGLATQLGGTLSGVASHV